MKLLKIAILLLICVQCFGQQNERADEYPNGHRIETLDRTNSLTKMFADLFVKTPYGNALSVKVISETQDGGSADSLFYDGKWYKNGDTLVISSSPTGVDSINFCGFGFAPFYGEIIEDTLYNGWVDLTVLSEGDMTGFYLNGVIDCDNMTTQIGYSINTNYNTIGINNNLHSQFYNEVKMVDGALTILNYDKTNSSTAGSIKLEDSTIYVESKSIDIKADNIKFDVPSIGVDKVWTDIDGQGNGEWRSSTNVDSLVFITLFASETTIDITDSTAAKFNNFDLINNTSDKVEFTNTNSSLTYTGEDAWIDIEINVSFKSDSLNKDVRLFTLKSDTDVPIVNPWETYQNTNNGGLQSVSYKIRAFASTMTDDDTFYFYFTSLDGSIPIDVKTFTVHAYKIK